MNIISKLDARVSQANSLLCVGLDSDYEKIPSRFKKLENPQFEFNKWIIHETCDWVCAYKPNFAFYEARGDKGIGELKLTMDYLRDYSPHLFTIADAKRADIGNTNNGYVSEIFDWLGFDAVTLSPFLGKEALSPFLERKDKVSIILCRTSNPGAGELQDLRVRNKPLWRVVAEHVRDNWNYNQNCMLVVGATYPEELKMIRELAPELTFLVPGVGAQGGEIKSTVESCLNSVGAGAIINVSRNIIFAQDPRQEAMKIRNEINRYRQR